MVAFDRLRPPTCGPGSRHGFLEPPPPRGRSMIRTRRGAEGGREEMPHRRQTRARNALPVAAVKVPRVPCGRKDLLLRQRGASVVLVDLKAEALAPAAKTLQQRVPGAAVATCAADVANQADCERAAQTALGRWGRIDVLVQAAGIVGATNVTTDKVDPANFDLVMRINVRGIFLMCRAVLPAMRRKKYGRIVNVASISGKEGNAGMLAYSTSKAAVIGLTKVIGKEFAEGSGITCNCLAPAVVRTEMVAAMPAAQAVRYLYEVAMEVGDASTRELLCWNTAQQMLQGRASRGAGIVAANEDAKALLVRALAACVRRIEKRVESAEQYERDMTHERDGGRLLRVSRDRGRRMAVVAAAVWKLNA